jgi:hypothetical protein
MALQTIPFRQPIVAALGLAAASALMCGLVEPTSVPLAEVDSVGSIDAEYRAASARMLYRDEQRSLIAQELIAGRLRFHEAVDHFRALDASYPRALPHCEWDGDLMTPNGYPL